MLSHSATCILLCAILFADRVWTARSSNYDNGPCFYEQRNDEKLVKIEGVRVSESTLDLQSSISLNFKVNT